MEESIFVYINGEPTHGIWIDLEGIMDWDEIKEILAENEIIPRNADDEPEYGGDLLVATTEGELSQHFYHSMTDTFDLDGFVECFEHKGIDSDAKAAYMACFNTWSASDFDDRYAGKYDSWKDYAENYIDDTGMLNDIPENLRYYFDYEAFARDLRLSGDMCEDSGFFFHN